MLMRYILGPLVLTLMSCGSTKKDAVVPVATLPLDLKQQFEDFNPTVSADGTKAAFVSLRGTPDARVYLYDASLGEEPVVKYADRAAVATGEQEWLTTLSADGNWVLAYREKAGASRVLLGHFSGTSLVDISIPEKTIVDELVFAPDSAVFAVVQHTTEGKTLRTFVLTGDATAVSAQELQSFSKASHARFVQDGATLKLVAIDGTDPSAPKIITSNYDAAGKAFSAAASAGTLTAAAARGPISVSPAGFFTVATLDVPRQRKQMVAPEKVEVITETLNVLEEPVQTDIFSASKPFDFTALPYRSVETLEVFGMSASSDGEFLVVTARDVVTCNKAAKIISIYNIIRRSDMSVIPVVIGRVKGVAGNFWTTAVNNPCTGLDAEDQSTAVNEFDRDGYNASFVSNSATNAVLMIETVAEYDREVRVLNVTLDWTTKSVTESKVTEISSNIRR